MVTRHFHFNGFSPNMLYFFNFFLIFLRRLYLVTPTFIIEPVIRLQCKRYVIKSQDLYVLFLRIDYIPPTVDNIHFFEMITFRLTTDCIQPDSMQHIKARNLTPFFFIQSEGLVCNPFARQTVCHQAYRLVCFFSSD